MKHIIGVVGKARSGKDTVADIISLYFNNVEKLHEATLLKHEVMNELNIDTIEELDHYKNNNKLYNGINIRKKLQSTADENKRKYGDDYYRKNLLEDIKESTANVIIIPDMRFIKTDQYLRDNLQPGSYITFKVIRDGIEIKESNHNSETEIDKIHTNFTIHNNGNLEDLKYIIHENIRNIVNMDYTLRNKLKK